MVHVVGKLLVVIVGTLIRIASAPVLTLAFIFQLSLRAEHGHHTTLAQDVQRLHRMDNVRTGCTTLAQDVQRLHRMFVNFV